MQKVVTDILILQGQINTIEVLGTIRTFIGNVVPELQWYNGSSWITLLEIAPNDGKMYLQKNGEWVELKSVGDAFTAEDGIIYSENTVKLGGSLRNDVNIDIGIKEFKIVSKDNEFLLKDGNFKYSVSDVTNIAIIDITPTGIIISHNDGTDIRSITISNTLKFIGEAIFEKRIRFSNSENNIFLGTDSGKITTGSSNVAIGNNTLYNNTSGNQNVTIGLQAMFSNIIGSFNVAIGIAAARYALSNYNTIIGFFAMYNLTTGENNTAVGSKALENVSNKSNNVGIGSRAGRNYGGILTNSANPENGVYIGADTFAKLVSTINEIVIGYNAIGNGSNTATIGDDNIIDVYLGENGQAKVHLKRINFKSGVAIGKNALNSDDSDVDKMEIYIGYFVGGSLLVTEHIGNTIIGGYSAYYSKLLNYCTFIGAYTGYTIDAERMTAVGFDAGNKIIDGSNLQNAVDSIFIGCHSKAKQDNSSNEIVIGSDAGGNGSNTATIGNDNLTDLYVGENGQGFIHAANAPSGLQQVTESGNTGIAKVGDDRTTKGNIGQNALDLSTSTSASSIRGATGENSIAAGVNSISSGLRSIAMGNDASAEGIDSIAIGGPYNFNTNARGRGSIALGGGIAEGDHSFATGWSWVRGKSSAAIACYDGIAEGDYALSIGYNNNANGNNSFAGGYSKTTFGRSEVTGETAFSFQHVGDNGGAWRRIQGNYSAVLGGLSNSTSNSATGAAVIGCNNIQATQEYTTYVDALRITPRSTLPTLGVNDAGTIVCDSSDSNRLKAWDGTSWNNLW